MKDPTKSEEKRHEVSLEEMVYTGDTPEWRIYYLRVRKTIRFPRYYKKADNR